MCWIPLAMRYGGMPIYRGEAWLEWKVQEAKQTAKGTTSNCVTLTVFSRLFLQLCLSAMEVRYASVGAFAAGCSAAAGGEAAASWDDASATEGLLFDGKDARARRRVSGIPSSARQ
ncbi:hypothetical protein ABPG75_005820 [Micractinium tetrahymenae]